MDRGGAKQERAQGALFEILQIVLQIVSEVIEMKRNQDNRRQDIGVHAFSALLLAGFALALGTPTGARAQDQPPAQEEFKPAQGTGTPQGQMAPKRDPKIDPARIEQAAKERAAKIGKDLGLSDEQSTQLANLNIGVLKQLQVLFNTRPMDTDAEKLKLQQMVRQRQTALEKLMTPDQLTKYQASTQKDWAGLISEIVARQLKLSADQVKRLDTINQQIIHKLQTIAGSGKSPSDQRKAIAQVRSWKDQQYARVLTASQMASLKQMRQYLTPTNADTALATENTKSNPYYGSPYDPTEKTMSGWGPWQTVGYPYGNAYGGAYGYSSVWPSYYLW